MSNKQLCALFLCNLVLLIVGGGPIALLPLYARRLGAEPAQTGYLFSSIFIAFTAGTIASGWLSDRLQRRKLLFILGVAVQVLGFWLIAQATSFTQLTIIFPITGFFVSISLTMVNTLAGLFAKDTERGRVFGILASAVALGQLIGGLVSGPVADRWGYPTLFTASAAFFVIAILAALFLEDKIVERVQPTAAPGAAHGSILTRAFMLVFVASIFAWLTNSIPGLSRPLIMDKLGFDATAISDTVAIGGLIALPLPLLTGWLSDRMGRVMLIILCYAANALGLIILASSVALWQFWISTALGAILAAGGGLGSALVTDLVPPQSLGVALSLFTATTWIGFIIGNAGTGVAITQLGMTPTLMIGGLLAASAILFLIPIGGHARLWFDLTPRPLSAVDGEGGVEGNDAG